MGSCLTKITNIISLIRSKVNQGTPKETEQVDVTKEGDIECKH